MRGEDRHQLQRVLTLLREVLGADVVGAYLFGSAVLGRAQTAERLDVLALLKRSTTRDEKQRLADRLLAISGRRTARGPWRRLELTIVVESAVKPWRSPLEGRGCRLGASAPPEEHRAVLARACAIYRGEEEERWDDLQPRVRTHADHLAGEINRLAGGSAASRRGRRSW